MEVKRIILTVGVVSRLLWVFASIDSIPVLATRIFNTILTFYVIHKGWLGAIWWWVDRKWLASNPEWSRHLAFYSMYIPATVVLSLSGLFLIDVSPARGLLGSQRVNSLVLHILGEVMVAGFLYILVKKVKSRILGAILMALIMTIIGIVSDFSHLADSSTLYPPIKPTDCPLLLDYIKSQNFPLDRVYKYDGFRPVYLETFGMAGRLLIPQLYCRDEESLQLNALIQSTIAVELASRGYLVKLHSARYFENVIKSVAMFAVLDQPAIYAALGFEAEPVGAAYMIGEFLASFVRHLITEPIYNNLSRHVTFESDRIVARGPLKEAHIKYLGSEDLDRFFALDIINIRVYIDGFPVENWERRRALSNTIK